MRLRSAITTIIVATSLSMGAANASTVIIDVVDFRYEPDPVNILVGNTVEWVFMEGEHSATSVAGSITEFDTGVQNPGFRFDETF